MPDTLSASFIAAKNALHSTTPWIWLLECDLDGTHALRVCGHTSAIIFGGNTYSPFPVSIGGIVRNTNGDAPTLSVAVSNVNREVVAYLEQDNVLDRTIQIRLALASDLTTSQDWGRYVVLDATVTLSVATFRLGIAGLFDVPFPARRIHRGRCDYVYGGTECAYDLTLPDLSPGFDGSTCDFSLEGSNGCRAHGANELANGAVVRHPERWGGCSGIPRGAARV